MRAHPRWASRLGGGAWGLLALAFAFASAGCTKTVTYTYIAVHVSIDMTTVPEELRFQINGCEFHVQGAETSAVRNLTCPPNFVPYDLGTFEWETQVTSGTEQFVVQIFGPNQNVIGEGTSDPVTLSPGLHLATSVLVLGIAAPQPDGGTSPDGGTDSGVDAGADAAPTDAPVDGGIDLAADSPTDSASVDAGATDVPPDGDSSDGPTESTDDTTSNAVDGGTDGSDDGSD